VTVGASGEVKFGPTVAQAETASASMIVTGRLPVPRIDAPFSRMGIDLT
jgi:hypothetical protein